MTVAHGDEGRYIQEDENWIMMIRRERANYSMNGGC